jgi:hypothetical protein
VFADFFRGCVRVNFSWPRFLAERWPVELAVRGSRQELRGLYAPWYLSHGIQEVPYTDGTAIPFELISTTANLPNLAGRRQERIRSFEQKFTGQGIIQLVAPAFALGGGRALVMDGNHRIAGLVSATVEFRLLLFVVAGPIEESALADLRHWARASR